MSLYPKKSCTIDDCPVQTKEKRLSFKDGVGTMESKYNEEEEIKTIDLCNDPCCSNVQQKKIVDLSQGLSQLENILKNMTGLCREPKCPSKNPNVENAIDSTRPKSPLPSRYYPEDGKQKTGAICSGDKSLRDILDYKTCKGSVCYNAYMGYKIESPIKDGPYQCGSSSCLPKKIEPKNICGSPTCPFDHKSNDGYASRFMDTTPKSTTMGACGGFTCPPKSDVYSSTFTSKLPTNNVFNDLQPSYLPPTNGGQTSTGCDFNTCPLNKQDTTSQVPLGLCGRTSCPYASLEYAQRLSQLGSKNSYDITKASTAPCGQSVCPFSDPETKVCGDPNCPFAQKNQGPPKVGLCGRDDCPYASVTPNVKPHTTAPCGNPDCKYGDTSYEPVGLCGDPCCPMMSKTSPGSVKPCPYADTIKRYPCGSPSCPYVNPSGMLHTHEYSYDRSYVQEAARPYCGSASPFDYMSSITPSYPSPLATNYPLFSYTEPPKVPTCPYMARKQKKSCGRSTCPYTQESDNFCIDKTCPFGEGICGGPRKYSCESPNVEYCDGPDCKVPKKSFGEGICGGPRKYSCESPNVEYCDGPDCKVPKKSKKDNNRSYTQESDNFCIDKTCPFGEGICGGPRKYSCESPNVEYCDGPDCKVPKKSKKDNNRSCCCGGDNNDDDDDDMGQVHREKKKKKKRNTCCRMPEVEEEEEVESTLPKSDDFCGSPICHGSRRSSSQKKQSTRTYLSSDIIGEETGSDVTAGKKPDAGTCSSRTCPYLKKLVFCDDCGGVLPDEDTPTDSTTETLNVSMEGTAGTATVPSESEKKNNSQIDSTKKRSSKQKDLVPLKKGFTPESAEAVPVRCNISLYDYPGVQIGHRDCSFQRKKIPRNMGWLWNHMPSFDNPEHWRGYKPGAILKSVYKVIKKHRRELNENDLKSKKRSRSRMRMMDLKHCIEVKKKEGEYTITVNPVKDPKSRKPEGDPYMDVTPMQFKVEKEKPEPAFCPCDEETDEIKSEVSTEFDFHFTPPAAIPDLYPKKKKNTVSVNVQYDVMDLPPELRALANSKSGGKSGGKGGKKGGKKGKKK